MHSASFRGRTARRGNASSSLSTRAKSTIGAPSVPSSSPLKFATGTQSNSSPSQPSKPMGKLIVGIDVGTTQCAVATAEVLYDKQARRTPRIKLYEGWVGFYMNHISTPRTALYYEEDGSPLTGNDLQPLFDDANPKAYNPDRLIRLWKLMFHNHQNEPIISDIQAKIQEQLFSLGKTTDDVIKDWARLLLDHLFNESGISSLRQIYENFDRLDLELVIAVPPGRTTIAHEQVLQAFVQGPIKSTAVSLESEPAALFRNWVHEGEEDQNWIVGKRYLVADGGGGTCCFVRFRLDCLDPLRFSQEFASESVVCGAETISDLFEKLIATKIQKSQSNRDWWIARIRNDFDARYKLFVGKNDRPLSFLKPGAKSADDLTMITVDEVKQCFAPCIAKLVDGIRRQVSMGLPADYLILGGGLFQNVHVLNSIKDEFQNLRVLETSKHKGAVAKGAVLSKIQDNFISSEEIARSKACITLMEVTATIKKSNLYKHLLIKDGDFDGRKYFWAAEYLVKQGAKSVAGQAISTGNSAKDAKKHYLALDDSDLEFAEKILTFNYRPGKDEWAAFTKDGTWINEQGKEIPQPEHMEKIIWNPQMENTVEDLKDLETERTKDGIVYRVLKYSLQVHVNETGTRYQAKIWSSAAMKKKTGKLWSFSEPVERKPFFTAQTISQSLADSFQLDENTQSPNDAHAPLPGAITSLSTTSASSSSLLTRNLSSVSSVSNSTTSTSQQGKGQANSIKNQTALPPANFSTSNPRQQYNAGQRAIGFGETNMNDSSQQLQLSKPSPGRAQVMQQAKQVNGYRTTGGCWTCLLRHITCHKQKPQCSECGQYGLECNYRMPSWWQDSRLKQEQHEKNKHLIQQYRERLQDDRPSESRVSVKDLQMQRKNQTSTVDSGWAVSESPGSSGLNSGSSKRPRDSLGKAAEATPPPKRVWLNDSTAGSNSINSQTRKTNRGRVPRTDNQDMGVWGGVEGEEEDEILHGGWVPRESDDEDD